MCYDERENTRKNTQRIASSSGEGVVTRAQKGRLVREILCGM